MRPEAGLPPREGTTPEWWGHIKLPANAVLRRRDSINPGDVVVSSHYGRATVESTITRGTVGPGTTCLTFEGKPYPEGYPADSLIPRIETPAEGKLSVAVEISVVVDVADYADDYGIELAGATEDARSYVREVLVEAARDKARSYGWFTVETQP